MPEDMAIPSGKPDINAAVVGEIIVGWSKCRQTDRQRPFQNYDDEI